YIYFFSSRRRHTRFSRDWSSDVCSSDLATAPRASTGQRKGEGSASTSWVAKTDPPPSTMQPTSTNRTARSPWRRPRSENRPKRQLGRASWRENVWVSVCVVVLH